MRRPRQGPPAPPSGPPAAKQESAAKTTHWPAVADEHCSPAPQKWLASHASPTAPGLPQTPAGAATVAPWQPRPAAHRTSSAAVVPRSQAAPSLASGTHAALPIGSPPVRQNDEVRSQETLPHCPTGLHEWLVVSQVRPAPHGRTPIVSPTSPHGSPSCGMG